MGKPRKRPPPRCDLDGGGKRREQSTPLPNPAEGSAQDPQDLLDEIELLWTLASDRDAIPDQQFRAKVADIEQRLDDWLRQIRTTP